MPRLLAESVRLAWRAGRREMAVMVAMQIASTVLVVAAVLIARDLVSSLLAAVPANGAVGELLPDVAALAGVTAALGAASAIQVNRQRVLAELCLRRGEDRVLAVTAAVPLAAFDDPDFHDEVERSLQAVRQLPVVVIALSGLLRALAAAVGAAIGLVAINLLLAPVVLLVVVPAWLAARRRGRVFYRFARELTPADRERHYLLNALSTREAAQEVRAYGLDGFFAARRARLWDERIAALSSIAGRQLRFTVLAELVGAAIVSGALLALVALALSHDISLAGAGVAAATIILLGQRLAVAASSAGGLSESALYVRDYLEFAGRPRELPAEPATISAEAQPLIRARAENVSFAYSGAVEPALREVSLEVAPGEVVALVGENGSGKTTLAKLLAGLYEPGAGRVTWNGVSPTDELRGSFAVVFQDYMRWALPARDNIGVGRHDRLPDDAGVVRAARAAGAHTDTEALPDGYATMLGPAFAGGVDLSVGQWQRIALARAFFRDAPFVILDEPTAALDARAEHDLFVRIRKLLEGRSVLLISHRFSSVREADRIYVMERGEIVESGTHDELVALGGRYGEMFELQAARYR
ncbi:MAG TPA: ABC transporter ATP-binding protein [Thermoleophilaceae bacterium]|nr:ABC transporter ATP-binding protein [Thermoleophilaceae bacterium]